MSEAEILTLISSIPKLTKTCLSLQGDLVCVKNEFSLYRMESEKRLNDLEQYLRRNSLLLESLRNVPRRAHGAKFSKFVVRELNKLFPHLHIRLADIDASHILYYSDDDKRSPVVIVKFVSRDLRNAIYYSRRRIARTGIVIREHLTSSNRKLYDEACESNEVSEVWSDQCKLFAKVKGQKKMLVAESGLVSPASCSNDPALIIRRNPRAAVVSGSGNSAPVKDDRAAERNPAAAPIAEVPAIDDVGSNVAATPPSPPINAKIMKVIEARKQSNTRSKRNTSNNNHNFNNTSTNRYNKKNVNKSHSSKSFFSKNRSPPSNFINNQHSVVTPNRDFQAFRGGGGNINYRSSAYPGAGSSNTNTNVFQDPQRWFPPVFFGNPPADAGGPYYYNNAQSNSSMHSAYF